MALSAVLCTGNPFSPLSAQTQSEPPASSRSFDPRFSRDRGNEQFSAAIEAVLHDIPSNFRHITGELVLAEGEIENYSCTVELPGAELCVITRYHSASDTTASWQAKMYSSEDFEKVSRRYHSLYNQLRSCYLLLADSSSVFLKGDWEPAREDIPFATSTLRLSTGEERYEEVRVQLEMLYQANGWVVNINIFNNPPLLSSN
jgi:hypothetical protein